MLCHAMRLGAVSMAGAGPGPDGADRPGAGVAASFPGTVRGLPGDFRSSSPVTCKRTSTILIIPVQDGVPIVLATALAIPLLTAGERLSRAPGCLGCVLEPVAPAPQVP
jgi:hypothetical protein